METFRKQKLSGSVLWHSSDKLERRKSDQREEIFQKIVSEQQRTTQETSFIYVNFDRWGQKLRDFKIIRLLFTESLATP